MVQADGTNVSRVFTSVCGEGASLPLRLQLDDIPPLYDLIFDCATTCFGTGSQVSCVKKVTIKNWKL